MCGFSHTQNVIVHCWRCVTSPQSALVDPVAASSGSYPAAPGSAPPDSCNLHPGLLQQHLWTVTLLLLVVVLIAFSIFPKQFATCKTEVVTPLTCITQLWVKKKKKKPIKSRTPLYYRTSWFLISFPEMSSPAVNDCAVSFCVFVKTDCWQLSGAGVASGFFFSVIKMSHHNFFNTCQPRPGLKQLITDVHQQVLTGHAQKHRANSEEDASSHHPLTHRIQVRWQQRSTDIILCYTTVTNRDNESHILVSMVPHCPHKVQQSAAHLCSYLKQNNRGIVKQIQHL